MNEFDIYTIGNGFFLERIFNMYRFMLAGDFPWKILIIFTLSLGAVASKWTNGVNIKDMYRSIATAIIIFTVFVSTTATVRIHDEMRDTYGGKAAVRVVQKVPWGIAFLGGTATKLGHSISKRLTEVFSVVFSNPTYGQTGMLFGAKLVEDVTNMRVVSPQIIKATNDIFKYCIVPDLNMGYARKNGYVIRDIVEAKDILGFLKKRSSKVRLMHFSGKINKIKNSGIFGTSSVETKDVSEYVTCNQAAHYLSDMIEYEAQRSMPIYGKEFFSSLFGKTAGIDTNYMFESVLSDSYGIFVKNSKSAKDILTQNIMINSLKSAISASQAYGFVTQDALTKNTYHSLAQVGQKFTPLVFMVLECFVFGAFPIVILLLFITPFTKQILTNYVRAFIYLQLWQPVYIIIYCVAGYWTQTHAVDSLTFVTHKQLNIVAQDVSMIAGYMLLFVGVLATALLSGLGTSIGSLSTSMFQIPQSHAMQTANAQVLGNYSMGNTQMGNHSYNNTSANKFNDNHDFKSGSTGWNTGSGTDVTRFADGNSVFKQHTNQLSGLAEADITQAIGSQFNVSKAKAQHEKEAASVRYANSTAAGLSKLFGHDESFNQSQQGGVDFRKMMSASEKEAYNKVERAANDLSERHGFSKDTAFKLLAGIKAGVSKDKLLKGLKGVESRAGIDVLAQMSHNRRDTDAYEDALNMSKSGSIDKSIDTLSNFARSENFNENSGFNENALNSIKEDFNKGYQASNDYSKAVEDINSIQEQESSFKSNQHNIRTSLNHHWGEWGKKKFGAAKFGEILKSSPKAAQQLMDKYIKEEVLSKGLLGDIKRLKYNPKDLKTAQSQFKQDFEVYSEKANNFTKQAAEEVKQDKDSPLQSAQERLSKSNTLKRTVRKQLRSWKKERKGEFENKYRKNKQDIVDNQKKVELERLKLGAKVNYEKSPWFIKLFLAKPEDTARSVKIFQSIGTGIKKGLKATEYLKNYKIGLNQDKSTKSKLTKVNRGGESETI